MIQELLKQFLGLFSWIIVVAPWEQALRVRLGRHVSLLGPGAYLRIPFIDRVYRQSIRRRMHVIRHQTITTKDGKAVTLSGALGFSITNLETLFNSLESPLDTIEALVSARVAEYIGSHALTECGSSMIERHVLGSVDLSLYGLGGQEFYINSFAVVRTYRFITGELPNWDRGPCIQTIEAQ